MACRGAANAAPEALELYAVAGGEPDPWQELALTESMWERPDGRWSALEVAILASRQNGKGTIKEIRQLWGLVLGRRRMVHTAHLFGTADNHFQRLAGLVESHPSISRRVKSIRTANGSQRIEMKDGAWIKFIARSRQSGRGLSADDLFLDECMDLPAPTLAAIVPLVSASPNPQIWYSGSVPLEVDDETEHIRKVRARSLSAEPGRLVWVEWSTRQQDLTTDEPVVVDLDDRQGWADANPALGGARMGVDFVAGERAAYTDRNFAGERLGVWPELADASDDDGAIVPADVWASSSRSPVESSPQDPVTIAVDTSPARDHTSIAAAGWSTHPPVEVTDEEVDPETGEVTRRRRLVTPTHGEIIDSRPGTSWVVPRIVQLCEDHGIGEVVIDPASPAGSFIVDLESAGLTVVSTSQREMAQACGLWLDLAGQGLLLHLDDVDLADAVAAAGVRPLGGGIGWSRRTGGDITRLVALTLAVWRSRRANDSEPVSKPVFWH